MLDLASRGRDLYTMAALEKALMTNATPLLHFAASKEFTGENIVFLILVRDWRAARSHAQKKYCTVTGPALRYVFNLAVEIFVTSISEKPADFPVSIASKICSDLEASSDRRHWMWYGTATTTTS